MPKPRIYVETTIPSAYHTDRTDPEMVKRRAATRAWWDASVHSSELVTSDVVLQELENGRPDQARLRLILANGLHLIQCGTAELTTALTYVRHKLMPGNPLADALHLAIASHHRCDVLLTWNYHHLANPNKLDRIRKLNEVLGLSVPRILTPKHTAGGWMVSNHEQPPHSSLEGVLETSRPPLSDEMRRTLKSVGEFIERARQHHARTGEWPPDPLLDEVEEMRRRVEAEHGNDPQKVLEWYVQASKRHVGQNGASEAVTPEQSAPASRP